MIYIIRIIIIHGENENNISGPGNTIPFTFSFDPGHSLKSFDDEMASEVVALS